MPNSLTEDNEEVMTMTITTLPEAVLSGEALWEEPSSVDEEVHPAASEEAEATEAVTLAEVALKVIFNKKNYKSITIKQTTKYEKNLDYRHWSNSCTGCYLYHIV